MSLPETQWPNARIALILGGIDQLGMRNVAIPSGEPYRVLLDFIRRCSCTLATSSRHQFISTWMYWAIHLQPNERAGKALQRGNDVLFRSLGSKTRTEDSSRAAESKGNRRLIAHPIGGRPGGRPDVQRLAGSGRGALAATRSFYPFPWFYDAPEQIRIFNPDRGFCTREVVLRISAPVDLWWLRRDPSCCIHETRARARVDLARIPSK